MAIHPLAGKPAPADVLIDVDLLEKNYYEKRPDVDDPRQLVSFGTSGHRGSPLDGTLNEAHILAITQAICEYRARKKISGPLFMGKDTHAVSGPAQRSALEVLTANGVETVIQRDNGFTPTPSISRAILVHNRGKKDRLADGIVVTPSHNPPGDGGFKYNPPQGGPADTDVTDWIQHRANDLLRDNNRSVKRIDYDAALKSPSTHGDDLLGPYIDHLTAVIDMDAIRSARVKIGVDPLGGAALAYWQRIAERYGLDLMVVNDKVDPTFRFMTLDHDGKIRMDCSSPYAMAGLVSLKDRFQVAVGNDADADRHGIVTPSLGLMNPNHYLAVAIWTTDKDGIILALLAAEIIATTERDPGAWYDELTKELGRPQYARMELPATAAQKSALKSLRPEALAAKELAGEPISAKFTKASGNGADIGGLKVAAPSGWFAVRPSGTEDLCKIYAESLRSEEHLKTIQDEAWQIVQSVFASSAPSR